jgi:bacteriocin-like protein
MIHRSPLDRVSQPGARDDNVKEQEKAKSASKKPAAKGKTELSDDELKKVTGGGKTIIADDWKVG